MTGGKALFLAAWCGPVPRVPAECERGWECPPRPCLLGRQRRAARGACVGTCTYSRHRLWRLPRGRGLGWHGLRLAVPGFRGGSSTGPNWGGRFERDLPKGVCQAHEKTRPILGDQVVLGSRSPQRTTVCAAQVRDEVGDLIPGELPCHSGFLEAFEPKRAVVPSLFSLVLWAVQGVSLGVCVGSAVRGVRAANCGLAWPLPGCQAAAFPPPRSKASRMLP